MRDIDFVRFTIAVVSLVRDCHGREIKAKYLNDLLSGHGIAEAEFLGLRDYESFNAVRKLHSENTMYKNMLSSACSLLNSALVTEAWDRDAWRESSEGWVQNCEGQLRARGFPFGKYEA